MLCLPNSQATLRETRSREFGRKTGWFGPKDESIQPHKDRCFRDHYYDEWLNLLYNPANKKRNQFIDTSCQETAKITVFHYLLLLEKMTGDGTPTAAYTSALEALLYIAFLFPFECLGCSCNKGPILTEKVPSIYQQYKP